MKLKIDPRSGMFSWCDCEGSGSDGGSGEGVDLSWVTATPETVLQGYVFADKYGNQQTGNITVIREENITLKNGSMFLLPNAYYENCSVVIDNDSLDSAVQAWQVMEGVYYRDEYNNLKVGSAVNLLDSDIDSELDLVYQVGQFSTTIDVSPSPQNFPVTAIINNGTTFRFEIQNLIPENIRKDIVIGDGELIGTYEGESVDFSVVTAKSDDVLTAKTFYDADGKLQYGSMPLAQVKFTEGTGWTVSVGYVSEDLNLEADDVDFSQVTATPEMVVEPNYFYDSSGLLQQGTMQQARVMARQPSGWTISAGYIPEEIELSGNVQNLAAENIRYGKTVGGVKGSFSGDATATAADIAKGKTAAVKGEIITGTAETGGSGSSQAFARCISVSTDSAGVTTWSGEKLEFDSNSGGWVETGSIWGDLPASGFIPRPGEIYSEDTTLWVREAYFPSNEKMVCLCHFDSNVRAFVDSTETCLVVMQPQADSGNVTQQKFGTGSMYYNYYYPESSNGGITINELPELDAFTVEFWHYHTYYQNVWGSTPILRIPESATFPGAVVNGYVFDHNAALDKWIHRAFVREAGSTTVREYWNGQLVQEHTLEWSLGGSNPLQVYGGGQNGDVRDFLDELAIFNYAKYKGDSYTPPDKAYSDIISGLHINNNQVRAVNVSGITAIKFANDPSYDYKDSSATGTSRVLQTADKKWFIYHDPMNYMEWIIASDLDSYSDNCIVAARLDSGATDDDQWAEDFDPIGHSAWIDNYTNEPITVAYN